MLGVGRAVRPRMVSSTRVSVLYEQRLYLGWWDLKLGSTLHFTFSTVVLQADHKVFISS